ncbi:MAG: YkgJ family cysteine cluster protein [Calothrix sp. SM1_5_4]|nr:YkgJ family cysteine cluster protein [Calothrix sp. SM1_5_4]
MDLAKDRANPCVSCGACCAYFRVQFYWREANEDESDFAVPAGLFEELTPLLRCMKGTSRKHRPQCCGLSGRIGQDARCSIYACRPTPCRDFKASFSDGKQNSRCDEARRAHGLAPLTPSDWLP